MAGGGVAACAARVRGEWRALYAGNVAAWAPINACVYGLVDLQHRVLAFSVATLLYTLVLSTWAEAGARGGERA